MVDRDLGNFKNVVSRKGAEEAIAQGLSGEEFPKRVAVMNICCTSKSPDRIGAFMNNYAGTAGRTGSKSPYIISTTPNYATFGNGNCD